MTKTAEQYGLSRQGDASERNHNKQKVKKIRCLDKTVAGEKLIYETICFRMMIGTHNQ